MNDSKVTKLEVETDDHQCGLGKWLYSDQRKEAEKLIPSLVPLLKKIEEPHRVLHESAIAIAKAFRPADPSLPVLLLEIEAAHLDWAGKVRDGIIMNDPTLENVETDPAKCQLGRWLVSEDAKSVYANGDDTFKKTLDSIPETHNAMHQSAIRIKEALAAGNKEEAIRIFQQDTKPMLQGTLDKLKITEQRGRARTGGHGGGKGNLCQSHHARPQRGARHSW